MGRVVGRIAVAGCLAAAALLLVFTVGLRTKSPLVLDAIRRMNRSYVNPRQRDAGAPGASAALIRHTGRTTGAPYETPVVAATTEDGFVIALPYGSRADWLKNVLASGSATVVHDGLDHRVGRPDIVPIERVDRYFAPGERRAHRIFGTHECLRVRRIDDDPPASGSPARPR
jgi:deazaflavin-dependent oxidoreductase (nitroreductase family)